MFGDPFKLPWIFPGVAVLASMSNTAWADNVPPSDKYNAATPAACGDDIDVPESVFEALGDPIHADVISTPGPKIETQDPYDVNGATVSV